MAFLLKMIPLMLLMNIECIMGQSTQPEYTPGAKGSKVVQDVVKKVEATLGGTNELLKRTAFVESKNGEDPNTYRHGYHGGIWQVDKIGFEDTQNVKSHPNLKTQHAKIKKEFGIDWLSVKYEDLRMPMYSGLASRLKYLNVKTAIPPSWQLNKQGDYWKKYYNTANGKGTAKKFSSLVSTLMTNDCAKGKKLFTRSGAQAHTVTSGGGHKQGPNLFGVCGRPAGSSPEYSYTDAMKKKGITWSEANLDEFLKNPKKFIPGTKMVFAGIKKSRDRHLMVHYLCHCI